MNLHRTLRNHVDDNTNINMNGVYMIYHISKPHFVYIGSTFRTHKKECKKGMYGRWIEHMSLIRKNKHHSIKLQRLVNKYGIEGLRFKSIYPCEECLEQEIRDKELELINFYDSFNEGLNCSSDTIHPSMSEESKLKSSERMKINNPMKCEITKAKMIESKYENVIEPVLVFNKEGLLIGEFKSTKFVAEFLNRDGTNVFRACIGEYKSCADHIIIYKKDYTIELLNEKLLKLKTKKKISKESILNRSLKQIKKVRLYNSKYDETFDSIKEAGKVLDLDVAAISKCCNGIQKSTKGFNCEFVIDCGSSKCG